MSYPSTCPQDSFVTRLYRRDSAFDPVTRRYVPGGRKDSELVTRMWEPQENADDLSLSN